MKFIRNSLVVVVSLLISSLTIGPVDEDFKEGGLQFIDEVKGGNIPKEFIPSVQKGFTELQ